MKINVRTVTERKPVLPDGKSEIIWFDDDIAGFGLRLRAGGSRVFIYQYSLGGHTRRMTLGKYPAVTAQMARDMVKELAAKVALGEDPAHDKQEAREHKETFGEVAALYLKAKASTLRPRTLIETERYLLGSARSLHSHPLASIEQPEIAKLLAKLTDDSGKATANRARANLSALFTWAAEQGKVEKNPVAFTAKHDEQTRERVLINVEAEPTNYDELVAVWRAAPQGDFGAIIKLLILTGARRNEIGGLKWSEIDLASGVINLPAERTKNGKPHTLPISKPMRAILTAQPRLQGRDFVFGRADGFAGWSASKAALDADLPKTMRPWTLHDLRRTAVTGMAELGVQPHVIEAVVNHKSGSKGGIAGIYNRANHYAERREALEKWGQHVTALVATPKAKAGAKADRKPLKAAA